MLFRSRAIAESVGYEVVAIFPLPKSTWRDYYVQILKRIEDLRPNVAGNPDAEAQIAFAEHEIAIYREHAAEYGYEFFILRRKG